MSSEKIEAVIIFEILGKPPEHIVEALEEIIKQIGSEKGVVIKEKRIEEPKELEKEKGMYTTFCEIIAEFDELINVIVLLFKYMPAHIQIISPEKVTIKHTEMNEAFNEVARRLHAYDEVARVLQIEKSVLETKLRELLGQKKEEKIEDEEED